MTTLDKLVRESETAKVALHLLWGLPLVLDRDDLHLAGTAGHSHVKILAQPVEKIFLVSWFLEKKAHPSPPQIQTYPQSSIFGLVVMHNFMGIPIQKEWQVTYKY
jgi:hypothetical protein